jgi:hypothetical protein
MKSLLVAGLFSALTINQANAQVYYNYADWDRLNESDRAAYIAGAYDSLVSIATAETASSARHYSRCVVSRQLSNEHPRLRGYASKFAEGAGAGGPDQLSRRALRRASQLARW